MQPRISVIIPCFNEVHFIDDLMENILSQDYPSDLVEILVADGQSTDGTLQKLNDWTIRIPSLQIIENENRYVSAGLNKCITLSTGNIIIRLDAHSVYPPNYISRLVHELIARSADNTGGVCITEAGADTTEASAIAIAISHPLGIGNATFRIGAKAPVQVDTVPFGCFKRDIFDRIGYFDEELIRNQDDEFNGRIIKNGGRIFLIPDVRIRYFARPTRKKTALMYYQYGLFKPLVNIKLGSPATLRQFAPPSMILYFLILGILSVVNKIFLFAFIISALFYFIPVFIVSLKFSKNKAALLGHLLLTFPTLHFSYGWGYIKGLFRFTIMRSHTKQPLKSIRQNR